MMRLALLLALSCSPVFAENWVTSGDAEIDAWYEGVQRNYYNGQEFDSGGRCCGKADAYYADKSESIDGQWIVTITDDRMVPNRVDRNGQTFAINPDIIDRLRQGNPTGHVVLFVLVNGDLPYCFFPGEGV